MTVLRELVTRLRFSYRPRDRQALGRYNRDAGSVSRANRAVAASNAAVASSNAAVASSFAGVGKQFAAFGAALGVAFTGKAISDAGNALDNLENRIRAIEGADAPVRAIRRELTALAQTNFQNIEDTTQIFQRFRIGTEDLGKSRQEILRFTDLVQKAAITSGSSPTETNAALIQFAQGIASNRFSGEEFRSVAEQLPTILRVLRNDLGVTIGELRELAFAGELTAETIFTAFDRQEESILRTFSNLRFTRAFGAERFKSGFTTFFGAFAQGSKFNEGLGVLGAGIGQFFIENEQAARRWGRATIDITNLVIDSFGQLFGGNGIGSAIDDFKNSIGRSLDTFRRFTRIYGALRERGQSVGNSFDITIQTMFGEDAIPRFRRIADILGTIGQAIGVIFATRLARRFLGALVGITRAFGPISAAIATISIGVRAWNRENSNLRALWMKLTDLWNGDFGTVMRSIGDFVGGALTLAFEGLVFTLDAMAGLLLKLIEYGDAFVNSSFVQSLGEVKSAVGEIAEDAGRGFRGVTGVGFTEVTSGVRESISNPIDLIVGAAQRVINGSSQSPVSNQSEITQNFYGPADPEKVEEATRRGVAEGIRPLATGAN